MSVFLSDPAFIQAHQNPLPFKFKSAEGHTVSFSGTGGAHSGYFVASPNSKTAIVMIHEWWGLNDYIKREAVRLHAATGYAVLAVDLYNGKTATDRDTAGKLMAAVDEGASTATVRDAVGALTSGELGAKFRQLGTIGWCFGGGWSLRTAIQGGPAVRACVVYYGMPDDSPEDLNRLKAPVLFIEALQDKWINPELVGKFKTAMAGAHKSFSLVTYDADHGFANPSNPVFNKADATDAMDRSIKFLKSNLH
jgi:carboxymethylenebutenolidase